MRIGGFIIISERWLEDEGLKSGMVLTENYILRGAVIEGLERNVDLWGAPYCPCKLEKVDKNICPCEEMRETRNCHCGLFERGTR
jgi:ferredoxin-thioredoxin reductase catalytic subunit